MPAFKAPDFSERAAAARDAKQKALDKLRAKPPVDEAVMAERRAAREAREAAEAEKREAKKAAELAAKIAAKEEAERIAEANRVPEKPKPTEAELKAARDARYAARKQRKR
jgi:hypothetical protein